MRYVVVAVATDGRRFKLYKGRIERQGAAGGEDMHPTPFEAITRAAQALRAWLYMPEGLRVTVEPRPDTTEAAYD